MVSSIDLAAIDNEVIGFEITPTRRAMLGEFMSLHTTPASSACALQSAGTIATPKLSLTILIMVAN